MIDDTKTQDEDKDINPEAGEETQEKQSQESKEEEASDGKSDSEDGLPPLEERYKNASKESIKNFKLAKKYKQEVEFTKTVLDVNKNPEKLHTIYESNQELGDKIALELAGVSYNELINNIKKPEQQEATNVAEIVRMELAKKEKQTEVQKIEEVETNFFIANGILPGSDAYTKIMEAYTEFKPDTAKKTERILSMAYADVKGSKAKPVDISSAPGSFSRNPSGKQDFNSQEYEALKNELARAGVKLTKDEYLLGKKSGTM